MPRPATDTRDRLLEGATQLTLSKGFSATSLEDVCTRAEFTKGAFFHYFTSKNDLGGEMLGRWLREGAKDYTSAPYLQETDPLDRLYSYIDFTIDLTMNRPLGCLVGIFSQELWQTHRSIRLQCAKAFVAWATSIQDLIEEAKAVYAPDAVFDPKSLAFHFIVVFEGALILAKSLDRKEVVREHLQHFKRYVQSLFLTPEVESE